MIAPRPLTIFALKKIYQLSVPDTSTHLSKIADKEGISNPRFYNRKYIDEIYQSIFETVYS